MSSIWFLAPVIIIIMATIKKLNGMNRLRARSFQTKLCISVMLIALIIFLYAMTNSGLMKKPMVWLGVICDDESQVTLQENYSTALAGSGEFYGIMFDAGSTGSRIHVFKFHKDPKDGSYRLLDELFVMTKPGLSSYADNPLKAADSLKDLLTKAKNYIPQSHWSVTQLALKATAGLRLLSNVTAQAILSEVTKLFHSYPFQIKYNSVSILEGAEEGLFCWFTLNFLNGLVHSLDKTVGILDLGGGSTQITYLPISEAQSTQKAPKGYMVDVEMFDKAFSIYTHSYLGLGINSARFQILGGKESSGTLQPGSYSSVCLPEKYSGMWKYGGREHNISSEMLNGSISRFEMCYSSVRSLVFKYAIHKPVDLHQKTFYALSYYYDRAVDVNLIDAKRGGQVKVQEFLDTARKECQTPSGSEPFLCLDLCYISSLLTDGFGFNPTSTLTMRKQVNDIEIAWSLGAMFSFYGKFMAKL